MRRATREERAAGAILDLVVGARRARQGDDLTLEEVKEYCLQACKVVAAFWDPPSGGSEVARNSA